MNGDGSSDLGILEELDVLDVTVVVVVVVVAVAVVVVVVVVVEVVVLLPAVEGDVFDVVVAPSTPAVEPPAASREPGVLENSSLKFNTDIPACKSS